MAFVRCPMGKAQTDIVEYIKEKAFDDSFTLYNVSVYSNRCTLNEASVANDTINRIIYVYADLSTPTARGSSSDYTLLLTIEGMPSSVFPQTTGSSRNSTCDLINIAEAVHKFCACYYSSGSRIALRYGNTAVAGGRYIMYGVWQY